MPYEALVYSYLEDALSECFQHHTRLDSFLVSCGLPRAELVKIREQAEERNKGSSSSYPRAPKRFVIQAFLEWHRSSASDTDAIIGAIISALLKGTFQEATSKATAAIQDLSDLADLNRRQKENPDVNEAAVSVKTQRAEKDEKDRNSLLNNFFDLIRIQSRQSRGYAFEKFLQQIFEHFGVQPRQPFRVSGEQIDGSIAWNKQFFLIEAKWTEQAIDGSDLGAFDYKLNGKGADTRGIFISVNGYSSNALQILSAKGSLRFMCLDGTHIVRMLQSENGLDQVLFQSWRHVNERGIAYLPTSEMKLDC